VQEDVFLLLFGSFAIDDCRYLRKIELKFPSDEEKHRSKIRWKKTHYWLKIFINLGNVFTRVPVMQLDVANRKTSLYTNVTKEK